MRLLTLQVPLEASVSEFVRLVKMFREGGYRIGDAVFDGKFASIEFIRIEEQENGG